ncbi:hypothetical protein SAMN05216354_2636 [Xylanibacter ruminicola]|uniref:Uncharacterized protein n=1 Tax=Xylanibacter ruminicola TaxID=839 RepID=A0A1H5X695_XYLRU|nr:hypothetical protein SAMN05216354_2636 [Xylanibacter ruminicola]
MAKTAPISKKKRNFAPNNPKPIKDGNNTNSPYRG